MFASALPFGYAVGSRTAKSPARGFIRLVARSPQPPISWTPDARPSAQREAENPWRPNHLLPL